MPRALLIEPDNATAQTLLAHLAQEPFEVTHCTSGDAGLQRARNQDFDLILLNVGVRDASASDLVQRMRLAKLRTPVLLLSNADRLVEVVRALSSGADDYLTLPVRAADLVGRMRELSRAGEARAQQILRIGKLRIDLERRTVEMAGERVHLTGKEFQMLELLALKKGTTVTKEMFLDHLYGGAYEPVLKIIDVFICKLRKKLAAVSCDSYIETIWGRGYVMRDPEEDAGAIRAALSA